jgi:hypothetical protein
MESSTASRIEQRNETASAIPTTRSSVVIVDREEGAPDPDQRKPPLAKLLLSPEEHACARAGARAAEGNRFGPPMQRGARSRDRRRSTLRSGGGPDRDRERREERELQSAEHHDGARPHELPGSRSTQPAPHHRPPRRPGRGAERRPGGGATYVQEGRPWVKLNRSSRGHQEARAAATRMERIEAATHREHRRHGAKHRRCGPGTSRPLPWPDEPGSPVATRCSPAAPPTPRSPPPPDASH